MKPRKLVPTKIQESTVYQQKSIVIPYFFQSYFRIMKIKPVFERQLTSVNDKSQKNLDILLRVVMNN